MIVYFYDYIYIYFRKKNKLIKENKLVCEIHLMKCDAFRKIKMWFLFLFNMLWKYEAIEQRIERPAVVTAASAQTAAAVEGEYRSVRIAGRSIRSVIGRECFPPFIG